jgi:hypothetical protein
MGRRLSTGNSPCDPVPPQVIDAAKRLFALLRSDSSELAALLETPD